MRDLVVDFTQQSAVDVAFKLIPDLTDLLTGDLLLAREYRYTWVAATNLIEGTATNVISLPTRATGTVGYRYELPKTMGKSLGRFYLSAGAITSLSTQIALGGEASDTTLEYVDAQMATVPATVRSTALTGLGAGANTPILAADTILAAFANLQNQISNAPYSIELRGDSECLPFNADWFGQYPNGWMDESVGGLAPRAFSDRAVSGIPSDGYTRFEATNISDVLQYISPVFSVNPGKSHTLYIEAEKLSGNIAMEMVLQCYSEASVSAGAEVVLKTNYDPTTSVTHTAVIVNPVGGAAPAFPTNTTTAILILRPTVGTVGAVGIKSIYFCQTDLLANSNIGAGGSGLHEGYFDGTKFYGSVFFAGGIAELNTEGTYISNVPAVFDGSNDPHEITGEGDFLYAAQWTAQAVQKYNKTLRTKVGSISLSSQVFSVRIYNEHLYATTVNGFLHRIRLSDFSLQNSWNIGFSGGATQGTVVEAAGSMWIHGATDGKVYRVHPTTGTVQAVIDAPSGMSSINNYGFGALNGKLYVSYRTGIMAEFDPATNTISNTWQIQVFSNSQLKNDSSCLWFVSQEPTPALVRFNPLTGGITKHPMRMASAGKWCEIVGGEIWCGGLDSGRIQRFIR